MHIIQGEPELHAHMRGDSTGSHVQLLLGDTLRRNHAMLLMRREMMVDDGCKQYQYITVLLVLKFSADGQDEGSGFRNIGIR